MTNTQYTKKRTLFKEIIDHAEHKNALVVTGMRQVGKTTLLRQVFDSLAGKRKVWFDLDNPLDQKIFEDIEYKNIYERLQKMAGISGKDDRMYVFIDEIQNFPEITKVIKYLIDHFGVKFFITGSSNFYLKNLFPESLSGRKFLFVLPPLSFGEYLYFNGKTDFESAYKILIKKEIDFSRKNIIDFKKHEQDYEEYIKFGGFPEVVLTKDENTKTQVLKNIFASFFEKDLKILSHYADIRELRDLILLLVPRVGSMLDVTKLSSELGVPRKKIYDYLEFLQGTFFIRLLSRFSKSIDRSVAGGRKVYFSDTGLLRAIGNVNDGQLFENAIVNQMSRYGEISFYSKRNTSEIDIILNKKTAFEVKLNGVDKDLKKVQAISREIGLEKAFIMSKKFKEEKDFLSGVFLL
jgi:predicted AAA+ superfamily ATPase